MTRNFSKSEHVQARLLPFEAEVLAEVGREEKLNTSEAIRLLIRAEAKRRGLWPPKGRAPQNARARRTEGGKE